MGVSYKEAEQAQDHAEAIFDKYASVVSIGVTQDADGFALRIGLENEPSDRNDLPTEVDGVPVEIDIVGTIRMDVAR